MKKALSVQLISPRGFCGGVKRACLLVEKALNEPEKYPRPLTFLGSFIHNAHVVDSFVSRGVRLLDEPGKSRMELLDEVSEGTVIFSAHGVSDDVKKKAVDKGLTVLDCTCPYVEIVHEKIHKALHEGEEVYYLGKKGHPECEGVLGLDSHIHLIQSADDIAKVGPDVDKKSYATNQTTLSSFALASLYQELKARLPNLVLDNEICNATALRQKAVAEQKDSQFCLVLGDHKSSNTQELVKVSQENAHVPAMVISSPEDLPWERLDAVSKISLTAGASAPESLEADVIAALQSRYEVSIL